MGGAVPPRERSPEGRRVSRSLEEAVAEPCGSGSARGRGSGFERGRQSGRGEEEVTSAWPPGCPPGVRGPQGPGSG